MSIRRILAFTGIRSDYDLMSGVYKELHKSDDFELKLIVSGAHLSDTYGNTVRFIEEDGLQILAKIETLFDSNSNSSRLKGMSVLLQSVIPSVEQYSPDLIIYPGDREDVMAGALIGAYLQIPTAHFFGGDHSTDGNVDNPVRHAASKLSTIHFVTNDESKTRLIHMGERENRIFNVGSPSLDKFRMTPWIGKTELLRKFDKSNWTDYALLIFHPVLGEEQKAGEYFQEILATLKGEGIKAFVSYPNVDSGNKDIIHVIEKHQQDENFVFYKNLNRELFINIMRNADFMIGNSSAGLYEAPILPLGAVNVGNRQKGRHAGQNVIFVNQGKDSIRSGIQKVLSDPFQKTLKESVSPYGEGNSIDKILDLLKDMEFSTYLYKTEDPLEWRTNHD